MLLILTLAIRHNLNMSCLADIINVINLHCPTHGLKKNSIFKFKKFFSLKKFNIKKHYYCATCNRELQDDNICPLCTKKFLFYSNVCNRSFKRNVKSRWIL